MRKSSPKLLAVILTLVMVMGLMPITVLANETRVSVNGQIVQFDQPIRMAENRILAPIRPIADIVGAEVRWNADTRTATVILGNTGVAVAADNLNATVRNMTTGTTQTVALPVAPRIYSGVFFMPIEAVSQQLGLTTQWDNANSMLHINTRDFVPSEVVAPPIATPVPTPRPIPTSNLADMQHTNFRRGNNQNNLWRINGRVTDFAGNNHTNGMLFFVGSWISGGHAFTFNNARAHNLIEYNLGSRYSRLTGSIVLPQIIALTGPELNVSNANANSPTFTVRFFGDGLEIASFAHVTTSMPFDFDIDVSNVNTLSITMYTGRANTYVALTNMDLFQSGTPDLPPIVPRLDNMQHSNFRRGNDQNNLWRINGRIVDFEGNNHTNGMLFFVGSWISGGHAFTFNNVRAHNLVEYNLGSRYSRLTGTIVLPQTIALTEPGLTVNNANANSPTFTIRFFGDGLEIASFAHVTTSMPFDFDVDVRNVNTLSITMYTGRANTYVALTNLDLFQTGTPSSPPLVSRLDNMNYSHFRRGNDQNNLWRINGRIVDFAGNHHNNGMLFFVGSWISGGHAFSFGNARAHNLIEYNLGSRYSRLTGSIVLPQGISLNAPELVVNNANANSPTFTVRFFGDGLEIAAFSNVTTSMPFNFDVNVSNVNTLSVSFYASRANTYVALTNLNIQ